MKKLRIVLYKIFTLATACFAYMLFTQTAECAIGNNLRLTIGSVGECVVDLENGSLNLGYGQNELRNGIIQLNSINLLAKAQVIKHTSSGIELMTTTDGLDVRIKMGVDHNQWLSIAMSVENHTSAPIAIKSLVLLQAEIARAFPKEAGPLKFYSDSFSAWDDEPGHYPVDDQPHRSMYMGALFTPTHPHVWMFSYAAPQNWSDMVRVDGKIGTISAMIEWWGRSFRVDPGETHQFDTLYITHALNLTDALLAHGARHKPYRAPSRIKETHGYNSWEWFKADINSSNQKQVVDFLAAWKEGRGLLHSYVLDNGWRTQFGDWTFDTNRFPEGAYGWAQYVMNRGFTPGVWLAPFWQTPQLAAQQQFPNYGPAQQGSFPLAVNIDPSIVEFRESVIAQIKALYAAGIRYFKTDFLNEPYWHYTKGAKFRDSKYPPERVLREFMTELRTAMGDDSFWLACGTTIAPCAGLVDAARVGADIKPKWDYLLSVVHRNAARFWMHGYLWNNDQDFLIIRGAKYSRPGFIKPKVEDIPAPGFNADEAETWCNFLVITGGPVMWGDSPEGTTPEGLDIVRRTLLHAGGMGGIPLDLQSTEMPTKWVRRESDRIYLGLFNWSNEPQVVQITCDEVSELRRTKIACDILHDREFVVNDGIVKVSLPPHASVCLMLR